RHLLVDAPQNGPLLHVDRTHDHQKIRLARRKTRELSAEAGNVIAAGRHAHVLHAAAGGHERVLEERVLARPAEPFGYELLEEAGFLVAASGEPWNQIGFSHDPWSHSSAPFFTT